MEKAKRVLRERCVKTHCELFMEKKREDIVKQVKENLNEDCKPVTRGGK